MAPLLDKGGHINLEILTGMITMDLLSLKTRRCGQILLVWARRHMEGTEAPSVAGSTLGKGWVATETIKSGFDQADFSVWGREENGTLKCLAFELTMLI
ncbi:hypothetical protein PQR65_39395 [Paraburkholderia nemoris]|uniref:hypothetical protein n=1 Tax=Paraburkholderia nemoris TaxID=2793076 RepID=UPI0038B9808D